MLRSFLLCILLAACDSAPNPVDTGTSPTDTDTAADSGPDTAHDTSHDTSDTDSGDTGKDSGDTGKDTGDTGKDTGDTGKDTGDTAADHCPDGDPCVPYACFCGECESSDISCVKQSWADANPCALMCPVSDCPELTTTVCGCDDATGVCSKK